MDADSIPRSAPPLPPTSNLLDSRQRKRLLRSTRKLGALLGTTPLITDPCNRPSSDADNVHTELFLSTASFTSPVVKRSRRNSLLRVRSDLHPRRNVGLYPIVSAPMHNNSSSLSKAPNGEKESLDGLEGEREVLLLKKKPSISLLGRRSAGSTEQQSFPSVAIVASASSRPQPLIIRLEPRLHPRSGSPPSSPSTSRSLSQSTHVSAPTTPGLGSPISPGGLTPTSPMFRIPTMAEIRRKRMAKLTRTLGEVVPAHLVCMSAVQSSKSQFPAATYSRKDRRLSVDFSALKGLEKGNGSRDQGDENMEAFLTASPSTTSSGSLYDSEGAVTDARVKSPVCSTAYGDWNRKNLKEVQHQLRSLRLR